MGLFHLANLCFNRNLILPVYCNWDTPMAVALALSPSCWHVAGNRDNGVRAVKGNSLYLKLVKILSIGCTQSLAQSRVSQEKEPDLQRNWKEWRFFFAVCGMLHAACLPLHLDAFFWPHCHLLSSFSKRNNYNKLLLGLQEKRWVLCWGVTDDYFQLRTCSWTVASQHIWNILFRGKKRVEGCGFSKCLHLFPVFLSAMWTFPLFTLLLTSWSGWVSLWPAVCKAVKHQASVSGCCFIWQGLVRKCSLV